MRHNLLITLLMCCAAQLAVLSQPCCDVRMFTIRDGLAANTISGLAQTRDDMMWFSTWNGLCSYDGYRFATFRDMQSRDEVLTSNRILFIRANAYGDIWCTSYDRHLYLFNTHECRFEDIGQIIRDRYKMDVTVRNIYSLRNGHTWVVCDANKANFRIDDNDIHGSGGIHIYRYASHHFKGPYINKVMLDDGGREWIFGSKGVSLVGGKFDCYCRFDYMQQVGRRVYFGSPDGRLAAYTPGRSKPDFLKLPASVTSIRSLVRLDATRLLVATDAGMLVLDTRSGAMRLVSVQHPSQPSPVVTHLYVDSRKRIWAFSEGDGVTLIDSRTFGTQWLMCRAADKMEQTQSDDPFVVEDNYHTVWAIPRGGTFGYYDESARQLVPYHLQPSDGAGIHLPQLSKFLIDRQNNLWFTGTHNLAYINFKYRHCRDIPVVENQDTRAVLRDHRGRLWAGTYDGALALFGADGGRLGFVNSHGQTVQTYVKLARKGIYTLYEDRKGRIWAGTKGDGIYLLSPDGSIRHFAHTADKYSLSDDEVFCIQGDSRGRIWIGTYRAGLDLVDEAQGGTRFFSHDNLLARYPSEMFSKIRRITMTADGIMIVSTTSGLVTFSDRFASPLKIKFYGSQHVAGDTTSLMTNDVMQTLVTRSGRIFVATLGGGVQELLRENLLGGKLVFRKLGGMAVDEGIAQSMIEDNSGSLWIIRESSIDLYNPLTGRMTQFGPNDFGSAVEFSEAQPWHVSATDDILLGTTGGIITLRPCQMQKSAFRPQIVFTTVQYQGESASQPLLGIAMLDVPASKRNLTVSFAALDYKGTDQIRYAYRLEGDSRWTYTGNAHSASFNHLPAGHYRLYVKSTNADGVWTDNIRALDIYAHPTFWETWWARLLYAVALSAIMYVAFYVYRLRNRAAMEHEMSGMKTRFFTEVSHQLRTPLTLIGGPVAEVLRTESLSAVARRHLDMVQRNARNMLQLVNSMLAHSAMHDLYISDDDAFCDTDSGEEAEDDEDDGVRLLVVEDNDDLRAFLASILGTDYTVLQAENGQRGLDIAEREQPDFILTDVMMPVMDGLTMVHLIKQNPDICHIPIIVLSAKASMDDRLHGLSEGIDDYITKPFSATYLKSRVHNIIRQRRMLQEAYLQRLQPTDAAAAAEAANGSDERDVLPASAADRQMMDDVVHYIEEHIGETSIKIDRLAAVAMMSRTVFYCKIRSLVGMAPVDFVRHIRMRRAEDMIAATDEPISQIAYAVGFSEPKYFSRCFRRATGMSPSEYRERKRNG